MTRRDAARLHNGDEVISKDTQESINVLHVEVPYDKCNPVVIEGVGKQSGYGTWLHRDVS